MEINNEIVISELNIDELNNMIQNNFLVTTTSFKKILLKKSFSQKKIIRFKIFTKVEFNQFIDNKIDDKYEYLIYKHLDNYNLSKEIFDNISNVLPAYKSGKLDDNASNNRNLKRIIDILNFLENQNILPTKNSSIVKDIYSLDINLDYLLLPYKELKLKVDSSISSLEVRKFLNIEDEVFFILNEVCKLIDLGIDIANINLYCNDEYKSIINILSNYYNLAIDNDISFKLPSTYQEMIIESLKVKSYNKLEINGMYAKEVFSYLNNNKNNISDNKFYEYSKYKLKDLKIKNKRLKNTLKVKNILDYSYDSEAYNFILGFNDYDFLKYKNDKEFLNDECRNILKINSSVQYNKKFENQIKNILSFINNNASKNNISYSKNTSTEVVNVNDIISLDSLLIIPTSITNIETRYSNEADIYNYKKYSTKAKKENVIYEEVKELTAFLNAEDKGSIDFKFRGNLEWDREKFKENKNISSTLIEKYYKCNFLFYLENILGVYKKSNNSLSMSIGTYIHNILENLVNIKSKERYMIDEELQEKLIIEDIEILSNKLIEDENVFKELNKQAEKILVFKINYYLESLIITIFKQINKEKFEIFASEEEIKMVTKGYNFAGKIDSILKHNDKYMVIDYKSGSDELKLDEKHLEQGINLQNIIYFILLKTKYENVKFAGTYRYKIVPKVENGYKQDEIISKRSGYTNVENSDVLNNIDIANYSNLKQTQKGFSVASKILSEEQFLKKEEIVRNVINEFIKKIESDNIYKINPLKTKEIDSCKYCSYYDMCYKNNINYRYLK